jgi:hypothetical protein
MHGIHIIYRKVPYVSGCSVQTVASFAQEGIMTRHPLVIIAVVAVIVIGLYYLISPYRNCVRHYGQTQGSVRDKLAFCTLNTSW